MKKRIIATSLSLIIMGTSCVNSFAMFTNNDIIQDGTQSTSTTTQGKTSFISKFNDYLKFPNDFIMAYESAYKTYDMLIKAPYNTLKDKKATILKDEKLAIDNLKKGLEQIEGQEKVKQEILNQVTTYLSNRNFSESGKHFNQTKAQVIYMAGPSGVGKTQVANIIAKALLPKGCKPCVADDSNIRKQYECVSSQVFGGPGGCQDTGIAKLTDNRTSVFNRIVHNANTILIMNEYDKFACKELEATIRGILDKGEISLGSGQVIKFNGLLIITSNESTASITKGNNSAEKRELDNDQTNSRTMVDHEQSILNRLSPIEFEMLTEENLKNIAQKDIKEVIDYIKQKYNTTISIDESSYNVLAKEAYEKKAGARTIEKMSKSLLGQIRINLEPTESCCFGKSAPQKELYASFNNGVWQVNSNRDDSTQTTEKSNEQNKIVSSEETQDKKITSVNSENNSNVKADDSKQTTEISKEQNKIVSSEEAQNKKTTSVNGENNSDVKADDIKNVDTANKNNKQDDTLDVDVQILYAQKSKVVKSAIQNKSDKELKQTNSSLTNKDNKKTECNNKTSVWDEDDSVAE